MSSNSIRIETIVKAPMGRVWESWTKPEHITQWAFASDDWEAPLKSYVEKIYGKV